MKGRDWFRVHSWIGVVAGLLLFVICWSGTVATVSHEIDWLLNPAQRVGAIAADTPRASWGRLQATVQQTHPDAQIEWMHAPRHARFAAEVVVKTPQAQRLRLYLHPVTAALQGQSTFFNVQRFFRSLHMGLFLPYPISTYLVCAFGILLLISTLAPLWFYKRWWTRFFRLRLGRSLRTAWSELHKLGGLWSLWFGLLIALTGIWYLIEQASIDLADAQFVYPPSPEWRVPAGAERLPLDRLAERAAAFRPDLDVRSISFGYSDSTQAVLFSGQAGHVLVRDRANKLFLDPVGGDIVFNQSASDLGLLQRWVDTVDPLHFGDFGGLVSQLIWFVFGLLLSGLCLTGAWLHAQRLAREARSRQRAHWPGTAAAVLVSLAVLVASAAGGWKEIQRYGATVNGHTLWPEVPLTVSLFLAAWVLVTLATLAFWTRLLQRPPAAPPRTPPSRRRTHSIEAAAG